MKERYVFKINMTNGKKYLQIWELDNNVPEYKYVLSCGSAEKLFDKLVKLQKLENQTKE